MAASYMRAVVLSTCPETCAILSCCHHPQSLAEVAYRHVYIQSTSPGMEAVNIAMSGNGAASSLLEYYTVRYTHVNALWMRPIVNILVQTVS